MIHCGIPLNYHEHRRIGYFFILYKIDLHMLVNQHPLPLLSFHKQYNLVARFRVDFHKFYIQARREMKKE